MKVASARFFTRVSPSIVGWTLVLVSTMAIGRAKDPDQVVFNQEIRPILSEYCYACHGPDEHDREAGLRLDEQEAAVEYGAIVPGDPDASLLIERIQTDSDDEVMPPVETGKKLSEAQKSLLVEWIRQGGTYQRHWSFEPVPEVVPVPADEEGWARNPIDNFVASVRREKNFRHADEVDRAAWLRRVTFDLTGLPPSLQELDAFLQDDSADAYEKVVNRLLVSPAYGERMASMWLDVARYADTFGYQNDVAMEVWPWRNWVIDAFNQNMPYDQFITEQIAGDRLPGATQQQRLATAFNRLHRQTNEGGSIPEEFRIAGIADRTTTAGTAFLGLTLECCRCHDHKFDPIKQDEFYRLSAYFSDIDEFGLYSHFTFAVPTPAMLLYEGDERERHEALKRRVEAAETELAQVMEDGRKHWHEYRDELPSGLPSVRKPVFSMPLDGDAEGVVGTATICNGDDEIVCGEAPEFGRTSCFSYSLWVRPAVQQPRMILLHQSVAAEDSGFRGLQWTVDDGHPEFSMIHFWPGNAVRIQSLEAIPIDQWTHLAVTHDGSGRADGLRLFINGKLVEVAVERDKLTRDVRHRKEWGDMKAGQVKLTLGARFRDVGFRDGRLDDLLVFDEQLSSAEILAIYRAVRPDEVPDTIDLDAAVEHQLLTADEGVRAARQRAQMARDEENEFVTRVRAIMTMQRTDDPLPTHFLNRGEYTNKGPQVQPGTPEFVTAVQAEGEDRLALARWMTDPRNPLTSRVIANRLWHLFFGRGIVVTLEDFGSQGTPPTHPELLDYLARSLMNHRWDLHRLCRQIVLSATYRQSSKPSDPAVLEQDPDNAWLARGPKHRLSAEQLRDSLLCSSGLLARTIGGPSVMPYQPEGLWEEAGTGKSYHQSTGQGLYRRSLYTFWKRTAPPPSMLTLDATSRESCTARRELTTTPLQALVFLNDPQYVEASRVLAGSLIASHGADLTERWNELFRRLISREPSEREQEVIDALYQEQLAYFREDPSRADEFLGVGTQPVAAQEDHADLAATTIVTQTLFAYDETIMLR